MKLDQLPDNPLTPEDEKTLPADQLVIRAMRPALAFAHQISRGRLSESELISIIYLAMQSAAKNFDFKKQRFLALAKAHIRFAVVHELQDQKAGWADHGARPETIQDFDGSHITKETQTTEPETAGIEFRDRWEMIQPALNKLSKQDREILSLYYVNGLNGERIAEVLGVSRSAVQRRIQKAIKKVRKELIRTRRFEA